jgi:hypothetical protein
MVDDDDDSDDESELFRTLKPTRGAGEIEVAEKQIVDNIRDVRYIVREYPVEVVVQKYLKGRSKDTNEIYVPDYQRDLIWPDRHQSRFVESLLIGLPVPFLFVADVSDVEDPDKAGRLEIVDGVQRIRTLARFLTNDLVLSDLGRLSKLNGARFADLHPSRQRRFRRSTLRMIELTETVMEDVRREMFDRINTGAVTLEAVEVRRGMEQGPFLELITELAGDPLLKELAPISDALAKRYEYEEFVTRFFAFLNRHLAYGYGPQGTVVRNFLLKYVQETNAQLQGPDGEKIANEMRKEWSRMLAFVRDHFPDGFRRPRGPGRKVPRVRFEAIAVGVGLALRAKPLLSLSLDPKNIPGWLESDEFKDWTTSDASNNRTNLVGRVEFVRDKLFET